MMTTGICSQKTKTNKHANKQTNIQKQQTKSERFDVSVFLASET
jgi:hypothetical protein